MTHHFNRPFGAVWRLVCLTGAAALVAGCNTSPRGPTPGAAQSAPAVSVAAAPRPTVASTAHPLATQAAMQMLAEGGTALDATIAAQMVLGLVEPQASGIGGGLLMLTWDARSQRLRSYDGLSAAPARTTAGLRIDVDGRLLPLAEVARGGRSVGVPGALATFELAHKQHGRLPWARLFEPAIALATDGYPFAPYAQGILARDVGAVEHPEFRVDHFDAQGRALPVGTLIRNPAYAATLRSIGASGVAGFYAQGGAARLVAAAQRGAHPSLMTVQDVMGYKPVERAPVCAPVRSVRVCTMGPPSFGGVTVLQMLQMLALQVPNPTAADLDGPVFWHQYVEAGRLAQADRRHFVGDPDHVNVPVSAMTSATYLRQRAALIDPQRAAPTVRHGNPVASAAAAPLQPLQLAMHDTAPVGDQTSQIVVADAAGNVVSTTTTNNLNFGSRLRVDGYVLNNALTNFDPAPERGQTSANQMAPGKRPITSMAPTIVFDAAGQPVVAGGAAGGLLIVDYITRNLIELLWLDRSPAQALAGGHLATAQAPRVQLEAGTPRAALALGLRERGHEVVVEATNSGAGFIKRVPGGWLGAADPRRDGVALGR